MMLKIWKNLALRKQVVCFLAFIIGYFSPLLGLIIFMFMKIRRKERIYQFAPICGGIIALFFYAVDYLLYIM